MERDLDTLVLRTFVAAAESGELAQAARIVGRSQGAASMQMQKLEQMLGRTLLMRGRHGVSLTEAGQRFLPHAKSILEAKDRALRVMDGYGVDGEVRIGMPQDFAETFLPDILGSFTRSHPSVRLSAFVERNVELREAVPRGHVDLALTFETKSDGSEDTIAELQSVWIGPNGYQLPASNPIQLVAFGQPCMFREIAAENLTKSGIDHYVSMSSTSLSGLWTGIEAGLGIAVRTSMYVPKNLRILSEREGLPSLPSVYVKLHKRDGELTAATSRLKDILLDAIGSRLRPMQP